MMTHSKRAIRPQLLPASGVYCCWYIQYLLPWPPRSRTDLKFSNYSGQKLSSVKYSCEIIIISHTILLNSSPILEPRFKNYHPKAESLQPATPTRHTHPQIPLRPHHTQFTITPIRSAAFSISSVNAGRNNLHPHTTAGTTSGRPKLVDRVIAALVSVNSRTPVSQRIAREVQGSLCIFLFTYNLLPVKTDHQRERFKLTRL